MSTWENLSLQHNNLKKPAQTDSTATTQWTFIIHHVRLVLLEILSNAMAELVFEAFNFMEKGHALKQEWERKE